MIILFIDDDPDDTDLFCEAVSHLKSVELFDRQKNDVECIVVNDGCEAVELLPKLSKLPDLIFLDINMPIMGGKDCLLFLKNSEKFKDIPVVIFSTAFRDEESEEFKALGAIECLKKPNGFNDLVKILSKYVYSVL